MTALMCLGTIENSSVLCLGVTQNSKATDEMYTDENTQHPTDHEGSLYSES